MEKITLEDYPRPWKQVFKTLDGHGAVYIARHATTNQERVIKRLEIPSFNHIDDYYDEVIMHLYASPHPNIVKILGRKCVEEIDPITQDSRYIMYILLEKMAGTLKDEIQERAKQRRAFTSNEFEKFATQITTALQHLEKKGVWHRDIDTSNIFVDNEGNYRLGDFGCSKVILETSIEPTSIVGKRKFCAPEIERAWHGASYGKRKVEELIASDVFSLGRVLYCMAKLEPIPQDEVDVRNLDLKKEYKNLLTKMMSVEIGDRPRLEEIQKNFKPTGPSGEEQEERKVNSNHPVQGILGRNEVNQISLFLSTYSLKISQSSRAKQDF
jgi:serine/threonine protein kinase